MSSPYWEPLAAIPGATGPPGPQGPQGPAGSGTTVPTPVNGQWLKGSGGAAIWAAITMADVTNQRSLVQMGTLNAPQGITAITFPQAFAGTPVVMITSMAANGENMVCSIGNVTSTGFSIYNGGSGARNYGWTATYSP